jgi:hypothetical protein
MQPTASNGNVQPELYNYGIHIENSDIRCHVAPGTKLVFIFQTAAAISILTENFPVKEASQPGVDYVTGRGYAVPWDAIPDIRRIRWYTVAWWDRFSRSQSTSEKGRHAVWVATELLRIGRFPLWTLGRDSERLELQIKGTDILMWGKWRIQVKCDYFAGRGDDDSGTGNLFLQTAERNPLRRI